MDLTVLGVEHEDSLWRTNLKHRLGWGATVLVGSHCAALYVAVAWGEKIVKPKGGGPFSPAGVGFQLHRQGLVREA